MLPLTTTLVRAQISALKKPNEREAIESFVKRLMPSFIPAYDLPLGLLHAVQSTVSYALMLAVM
jgi:hypothetical protein